MAKDRRLELIQSGTLNGVDFVEVASADQKTLRVHFLNAVPLQGTVTAVSITGGERIAEVKADPIDDSTDWSVDADGNPVLTLQVAAPGDFSFYTLALASASLDPFTSSAKFSFKALCDSPLDCRTKPTCPEPELGGLPAIDYLAKDFHSFRQALSDFSAVRYPNWQERSEADFGVMFMEALSAVADDFSYTQDRMAAEATLDTATQRRSLVRLARLVDYEPRPATVSRVDLQIVASSDGNVAAGTALSAADPEGGLIPFEVGAGLVDATAYAVRLAWNELKPYYIDDAMRCLRAGSQEMFVEGINLGFAKGTRLLVDTSGITSADPPIREILSVASVSPEHDPIFNVDITRIVWTSPVAFDHDLTRTTVRGNLVPATQGLRYTESFVTEPAPLSPASVPVALTRTGPNGTPQYLFTLANAPIAWAESDSLPRPEIRVLELRPPGAPRPWLWTRSLLAADEFDSVFTVDPARYIRTRINSDSTVSFDYAGDDGDTIRFGDGTFGDIPEEGRTFQVTYRKGAGSAGNVAADSVWRVDAAAPIASVTNPFAATGGADEESDLSVRRRAPEAFRAVQYRAVVRQDYEAAAQTLAWVQRAGTKFRWTGSWLTVFTTPDPEDSAKILTAQQVELVNLLNRYRLAGYESYVPAPRYAAIDLKIQICAMKDFFRGEVYQSVLERLGTRTNGFFHVDNFTFGTPLERSRLEAAIQSVTGVGGIISIQYRRRGFTTGYINMPVTVKVGLDEIVLVENNPSTPERGSLQLYVEGGK